MSIVTKLSPGESARYDCHWSSVYHRGIQDRDEEKSLDSL